ncbi:MAG: type II toxin-antitoxin system VapC family toxin [Microcystis panniformis]|jgi:PIN domain nuclease of toxin-antitoxin system|uniref:PIN domain-containing protein n=1 Tax=Microcystis aeruginosa PCC 9807 TaxID=1160283 RepID=I4HD08_MICAE|nr:MULTISPECIES: type II toxin-antitoxin system VapC family toxin [Microcystis]MBE5229847.1 type II toxin-antitoxin system VapC family toxin [Microcystis aeruginosa PMC 728.11]NCQ90983.1 type II toxin-antitoxin system VapC family toxin [Microcystis aeruginosa LG13-13]NCR04183.1 type II toxin-antitoxin system VapC family toxin [Microcystis aeruginosa LG13-03]NCR62394.1 type II toxin-antitoxin system VapC family toxin [Microcystis aeruginosa LG11-05]NCR73613.1 type II toxin-antitoxin system VapC
MKLLLDTHTFLWFINNSPQLSIDAKNLIESDVDLLLSIASLWEIAIKVSIGKLTIPNTYDQFIPQQVQLNDMEILSISMAHLTVVTTLPFHHRDPFDRLLIAQAMVEKMSIISADEIFDSYGISRIW